MISPPASQPRRVAVTAIGVVSPLGLGCDETTAALRSGRDGVTPVTAFDVSKTRCKTAGLVDVTRLKAQFGSAAERRERLRHPASLMMMAAAAE
ncbi:MAG TPA: beta-ketoacyl synthase N-terminal-like domain-containing protein, partial [Chthoniobacter sp.]|nr:beta-ketoacyl synthase N-terminal-like domain-containing protein [Chthoniobacter sp.]